MARTLPRKAYLKRLHARTTPGSKQRFRQKFSQAKRPAKRQPPEDFLAPRPPGQVRKEGRKAAELEFGPTIRAKQAQIGGARTFAEQKLPSLYYASRQEIPRCGPATQQA